ncbi:putative exported phage protein [Burkholderia aenigmatica]|uniref:gp53-like domain-containing protein n=1 Tax=Burkholderia aenigmatica TaxID=2015348 RepID=UPI0014533B20|nr:hypothetical protein [Burkholderia aenigmatica]VWC53636.1 putative exported phage protein [Burkholderia aenigmatica]
MFRTDQNTAVTALPVPAQAGTPGFFTGGNPATGQAATIVDADWLNMIQEELVSILVAAGVTPSKTTYNQVLAALKVLFAGASGNANTPFEVETVSHGDSSNNAASTAYVWGVLGNYGGFFPFNAASQQLTAAQSGDLVYFFGSSAGVVTLPQGSSIQGPSARFVIYNGSLANLTVSAFAGDVWQNWARASEIIGPGDSIEIAWSNGQFFNVVGGTAALKRSSLFAANGSPNGWEKLPSGMIRQWGVVTVTNASETGNTFNFPIAFPNACFVLNGNDNGTPATGGNGGKTIGIGANSNSQFSVNALLNNVWQSGVIVGWQAVGW